MVISENRSFFDFCFPPPPPAGEGNAKTQLPEVALFYT
jgi:hypothetical protein